MNFLLKYLIESSIIISVFYLIYLVIYNGGRNFKFNRLYLISSSFLAIFLPLLNIPILSTQEIAYPTTLHQAIQLPEIIINENTSVISSQPGFTMSQVIALIYLIGFTYFLSRLLFELFITYRYIRVYSKDSQKTENYTIIKTKGNLPTCSFFKYLFWDDTETYNEKETNFIIRHEEGHIRQNHTFDLIYLEILRIIFWFNPIVHGYKKAMLVVHEFLADEFALVNANSQSFISLLARQVLQKYHLTLSNHFSKSQTIKRIKMIKSGKKKPAVLRWAVLVSVVIAMFYIFSCEQGYTLNDIGPPNKDLPILGEGWTYISSESYSLHLEETLNKLKLKHPSVDFYVAEGLSGKAADFNFNDIRKKYSFETYSISLEDESIYAIMGEVDKEIIEIDPVHDVDIDTDVDVDHEVEADIEGEKIFTIVDDIPEPIGGLNVFYEYISSNLIYPEEARKARIEGKVFIQFIVTKEGKITNVKCVRGIHELCDTEAVKIVSNSPEWQPGRQDGKKVNVRMIMPIAYNLGSEN